MNQKVPSFGPSLFEFCSIITEVVNDMTSTREVSVVRVEGAGIL